MVVGVATGEVDRLPFHRVTLAWIGERGACGRPEPGQIRHRFQIGNNDPRTVDHSPGLFSVSSV